MKHSLKLRHWRRYKDIGLLALRYGDSDFAQEFGTEEERGSSARERAPSLWPSSPTGERGNGNGGKPVELANELERMGPTFVKLGQVLSSRVDLLPPSYVKALS